MTQQRRKSTLTPSSRAEGAGGGATNNNSTGSRKNGAIRSRSSANRYSDLEKQEETLQMRSEFKLDEDDDSTKRNKVKYFAVQINSPMEENKK